VNAPTRADDPIDLDAELAFAHRLADLAAGISMAHFRTNVERWTKADGSIATAGDLAVEDALRALVARDRPQDAFLGEERGQTGEGRRRWIVDGIDGTADFAADLPDWGTLIALESDGRIHVGVCDQPVHRRRYWAARGRGAYVTDAVTGDERRLSVSRHADLRTARTYVPNPEWARDEPTRACIERLRRETAPQRHPDHPALLVASGAQEATIYFLGGAWDLAAPLLVVEEAGGRYTDAEGRYDWTTGSAIFSNGVLHDALLPLTRTTTTPPGIDTPCQS
jgi:histidinol-phosphatase